MSLKIRSVRWRKGLANASMNLNFCVKWHRQTASGGSAFRFSIGDCRFKLTIRRCGLRNSTFENRKCDEPYEHHRAADFRRYSRIFSHLRGGLHAEIQGRRVSVACAVSDQRLGTEKADYVGPHRFKVARPIGARKCCAPSGESRAESDQPSLARHRA